MQDQMDLLGDLSRDDAKADKLIFKKGEKIEFVIKEFKILDHGKVLLNCTVLTGEHATKPYTIFIPDASNDIRKKQRAAFFWESGIWTDQELTSKTYKLARLMGYRICGVASAAKDGKEGNVFQDITQIKALGPTDVNGAASSQNPQAAAAPAVVGAQQFQ